MMNRIRLLTPIILAVLASCSTKESAENTEANVIEFSYEIDTVKIDAKGEFLFLNLGLTMSDFNHKSGILYNLNPMNSRMEVIDLEKGELVELIQYDRDGPNAVQEMITTGIKITDSGEKWFTDYRALFHLDSAGKRIGKFSVNNDSFSGDTLPEKMQISLMGKISNSGKYLVSHYGDYILDGKGLQGVAVMDLENQTKRLIPLDVFHSLDRYKLSSPDGERAGARAGESNYISITDKEIIHSNSAQNQLISLNITSGEMREVKLKSTLLLDEKPGLYPNKANSIEQFEEFNAIKKQELTFGPWIHDPERGYFWRISRDKKGGSVADPVFSFVITILDSDLKQIAETELSEGEVLPFGTQPSQSFFWNGNLYMFLNLEDELGFVRIKPTYDE